MIYRKNLWSNHRSSNLRLVLEPSLSPEVKRCCKKFHKWIRKEFVYPIPLTIYVLDHHRIRSLDGDSCVSGIYYSDNRPSSNNYPFIRIAGKCNIGNDASENRIELGSVLHLILTHISHYFQWVENDYNLLKDDAAQDEIADKFADNWMNWYVNMHDLYIGK